MNWTDRLNPIFLQSLRQSLRGRVFLALTLITLLLTLAFSLVYIIAETRNGQDPSGQWFFLWIYGALSFAVHLFVPFAAFISLGNEWDENTYDLLVLSNLKPRNIVGGKLLSAMLLAGLWLCSFGPFLAFSFLLPGTDLYAIAVIILLTAVGSASLTCVALFLSSIARGRMGRTMLMAILAAALCGFSMMAIGAALGILESPSDLRSALGQQTVAGVLTVFVIVGAYCFAFACTRLAHAEENRSTSLRVISSLTMLAAVWWLLSIYRISGVQGELLLGAGTMCIVGVALVSIQHATEEARLGRRVALDVPKNRWLAFLVTPWLPGGGRGVLFFWTHMALLFGGLTLIMKLWPSTLRFLSGAGPSSALVAGDYSQWWWLTIVYSWIYIGIAALIFRPRLRELSWRIAARVSVFIFLFLGLLLPTLFFFVVTGSEDESFAHIGNPVWMFEALVESRMGVDSGGERALGMLVVASFIGGALFVAHLPGVVRGIREVQTASAERRAKAS